MVDHLVAAREHCAHVEPFGAQAGHAARLGQQLARTEKRFRRHARVVGALAADEMLLDGRHAETALPESPGGDLARRPGPEHDDVECSFAHDASLSE